MPGLELARNAAVRPLPSGICRDGHDARPVEGSPIGGGRRMPAGVPKLISAADKRQGDEPRVVTLFHAKQNAALSFSARTSDHIAHVGRC